VSAFVPVGLVAILAGGALVVSGIRKHEAQHPRHVAMLIGGMMLTAFGIVIAGFAIAYNAAAPLDLNTGATQ
jgi:hypothetical protein